VSAAMALALKVKNNMSTVTINSLVIFIFQPPLWFVEWWFS